MSSASDSVSSSSAVGQGINLYTTDTSTPKQQLILSPRLTQKYIETPCYFHQSAMQMAMNKVAAMIEDRFARIEIKKSYLVNPHKKFIIWAQCADLNKFAFTVISTALCKYQIDETLKEIDNGKKQQFIENIVEQTTRYFWSVIDTQYPEALYRQAQRNLMLAYKKFYSEEHRERHVNADIIVINSFRKITDAEIDRINSYWTLVCDTPDGYLWQVEFLRKFNSLYKDFIQLVKSLKLEDEEPLSKQMIPENHCLFAGSIIKAAYESIAERHAQLEEELAQVTFFQKDSIIKSAKFNHNRMKREILLHYLLLQVSIFTSAIFKSKCIDALRHIADRTPTEDEGSQIIDMEPTLTFHEGVLCTWKDNFDDVGTAGCDLLMTPRSQSEILKPTPQDERFLAQLISLLDERSKDLEESDN